MYGSLSLVHRLNYSCYQILITKLEFVGRNCPLIIRTANNRLNFCTFSTIHLTPMKPKCKMPEKKLNCNKIKAVTCTQWMVFNRHSHSKRNERQGEARYHPLTAAPDIKIKKQQLQQCPTYTYTLKTCVLS